MIHGSIDFVGGGAHMLDCGSPTSLDNITQGTVVAIVNQRAAASDRGIFGKGASGTRFQFTVTSAGITLEYGQTGTICRATATHANLPMFGFGLWNCYAASFKSATAGGANGDQVLYGGRGIGAQMVPIQPVTTYANQQVGSGTHDDSASSLAVGRNLDGAATTSFDGCISHFWIFATPVPRAIIAEALQRYLQPTIPGYDCRLSLRLRGSGVQWDRSGRNSHGIPTNGPRPSALGPTQEPIRRRRVVSYSFGGPFPYYLDELSGGLSSLGLGSL